jgi:hypothetical protein
LRSRRHSVRPRISATGSGLPKAVAPGTIHAPDRWAQTKRKIWLLAIGTFVVEAPIAALAAMVILAQ